MTNMKTVYLPLLVLGACVTPLGPAYTDGEPWTAVCEDLEDLSDDVDGAGFTAEQALALAGEELAVVYDWGDFAAVEANGTVTVKLEQAGEVTRYQPHGSSCGDEDFLAIPVVATVVVNGDSSWSVETGGLLFAKGVANRRELSLQLGTAELEDYPASWQAPMDSKRVTEGPFVAFAGSPLYFGTTRTDLDLVYSVSFLGDTASGGEHSSVLFWARGVFE